MALERIQIELNCASPFVIAGLDPAIHAALSILRPVSMDARVKPAHDGGRFPDAVQREAVHR
jgi:hypothetical protein